MIENKKEARKKVRRFEETEIIFMQNPFCLLRIRRTWRWIICSWKDQIQLNWSHLKCIFFTQIVLPLFKQMPCQARIDAMKLTSQKCSFLFHSYFVSLNTFVRNLFSCIWMCNPLLASEQHWFFSRSNHYMISIFAFKDNLIEPLMFFIMR